MIDINIYSILGTAVLGNMIAYWYSPIQTAKVRLILLFKRRRFIHGLLDEVLNCSKCSSFMLGIIVFWDLPVAALVALLGFIINFIIDFINEWYE